MDDVLDEQKLLHHPEEDAYPHQYAVQTQTVTASNSIQQHPTAMEVICVRFNATLTRRDLRGSKILRDMCCETVKRSLQVTYVY